MVNTNGSRMQEITDKELATEPGLVSSPAAEAVSGWRHALHMPSLPEAHRTIRISPNASWFRKILAFAGPGYLVAVGYMDPEIGPPTLAVDRSLATRYSAWC